MRNKIQVAFDLGSHSIKSAVGRIQQMVKLKFYLLQKFKVKVLIAEI